MIIEYISMLRCHNQYSYSLSNPRSQNFILVIFSRSAFDVCITEYIFKLVRIIKLFIATKSIQANS